MGKAAKMFPEKVDIKLIELVRENPIIYNHNDLKYMDYDTREVVWQKIGDELQRPAGDCKNRWVNIRDSYRRLLKLIIKTPGNRHKPYKYDKQLCFLKPYLKDIAFNIDDEFQDDEFDQDDDFDAVNNDCGDSNDFEPKPVKLPKIKKVTKRKKMKREEKEAAASSACTTFESVTPSDLDSSDSVDAFLLSIGATLKSFTPYHLNIAKSKIFAIVQEHELQQIVDGQNHVITQPEDMKNHLTDL